MLDANSKLTSYETILDINRKLTVHDACITSSNKLGLKADLTLLNNCQNNITLASTFSAYNTITTLTSLLAAKQNP